jgi:hypothetical protein
MFAPTANSRLHRGFFRRLYSASEHPICHACNYVIGIFEQFLVIPPKVASAFHLQSDLMGLSFTFFARKSTKPAEPTAAPALDPATS